MEMHTNVTETKIKVSDIVESCICPFVHIRQLKPNSREKIVIDESDFPEPDPHGMPPEPCHEHLHD